MERYLAAAFRLFCAPAFFCIVVPIPYFVWHGNFQCAAMLMGALWVGPAAVALFLLPANLLAFLSVAAAKTGSRTLAALALAVNLTAVNLCAGIAVVALFMSTAWYGLRTEQHWALFAAFGASTWPSCWIAMREKFAGGGLLMAASAGAASSVMAITFLLHSAYVIGGAFVVYVIAIVINWFLSAPLLLSLITPTSRGA